MPTPTVNIEPMERLADKVKGLIGVLERTRTELSQTIEYNLTLSREVEHVKAQLAMVERTGDEVAGLVAERDQIRTRVGELLEQLDGIAL